MEWEIQIGQNDPAETEADVVGEQRDESDLQRHDLQREDRDEQGRTTTEVDPGEPVGSERGEHQRK